MAEPPAGLRSCPRCGAEYRAGSATCADCGVALVETPPPVPGAEAEPPVETDDHEPAGFDLHDWPTEQRESLQWMLDGQSIPYAWEPPGLLLVPAGRQDEVEGFVEYIDSGASIDDAPDGAGSTQPSPWWPDAESPDDADRVASVVALPSQSADDRWEVPAPLRWLTVRLDDILECFLAWRSQLDAAAAFGRALVDALDEASYDRIQSYFDGDHDAVDGAGAGESARAALLRTFEGRANHPSGGTTRPPGQAAG